MHDDKKKNTRKKVEESIDRTKFESLTIEAKTLEKEINAIIKNFEKKYSLNCWVTLKRRNQIVLDISIDREKL